LKRDKDPRISQTKTETFENNQICTSVKVEQEAEEFLLSSENDFEKKQS
jgi:hypothetical protein